MKKYLLLLTTALPGFLFAQDKPQGKETEQIIITKKGVGNEKMNIVVDGDNITVNGAPVSNDKNSDITVKRMKIKDFENFSWSPKAGFDQPGMNFGGNSIIQSPNKAMLGVIVEKTDDGVKIVTINDKSPAEKAGLKEGDIITAVDATNILAPDELSESLKHKQPGDKATISYLRDGKKETAVAELTQWTAPKVLAFRSYQPDSMSNYLKNRMMDKMAESYSGNWGGNDNNFQFYGLANPSGPKLGIQIQETETGNGVKIINVDKNSDADKAGLKEGDIIEEANGEKIDNAEEIMSQVSKSRTKKSISLKINRDGKLKNIEVGFSKKLKSADL